MPSDWIFHKLEFCELLHSYGKHKHAIHSFATAYSGDQSVLLKRCGKATGKVKVKLGLGLRGGSGLGLW